MVRSGCVSTNACREPENYRHLSLYGLRFKHRRVNLTSYLLSLFLVFIYLRSVNEHSIVGCTVRIGNDRRRFHERKHSKPLL